MHLGKMLEGTERRWGSKTAVKLGDDTLSYTELNSASNRLAHSLRALGIKHGDRVVILLNNSPQFVICYFGIVKLGAIAVPLDTKYRLKELSCLFEDCRPMAIIMEEPFMELLEGEWGNFPYTKIVIEKEKAIKEGHFSIEELVEKGLDEPLEDGACGEDVAHIAYTSGPVLKPAGVITLHKKLTLGVSISANSFKQTDKDIVLQFALPMHHMVGLVVVMLTALYSGSTLVMQQGISTTAVMETIKKEGITILLGVPFIFAMLVRDAKKGRIRAELALIRLCASVGAPLPMETFHGFREAFGQDLLQFYGLTETTVHVTCQPDKGGIIKPGSVGVILPHFEIIIIDEDGEELVAGKVGQVIIKGPIMKGYYNNSCFDSVSVRNGWLYTGDCGYLDADGSLYITGINKPMFISKGQNIYFLDLEETIAEMKGVKETAVTAVPDPDNMRGQVARVFVCREEEATITETDIKHHLLKQIANYKVPKQIVFLDRLPHRKDGTIDRTALSNYTAE